MAKPPTAALDDVLATYLESGQQDYDDALKAIAESPDESTGRVS